MHKTGVKRCRIFVVFGIHASSTARTECWRFVFLAIYTHTKKFRAVSLAKLAFYVMFIQAARGRTRTYTRRYYRMAK